VPTLPASPCRHPRCPARASKRGFCDSHARSVRAERRERNHEHLYDSRWWKESRAYLLIPGNQHCLTCALKGIRTPANTVAHRIAHKGNVTLFWDRANWQPSCRECNSRQAVELEGGFGGVGSKVSGADVSGRVGATRKILHNFETLG
jgi:5-methylcytosine-specific restriction enzyme A